MNRQTIQQTLARIAICAAFFSAPACGGGGNSGSTALPVASVTGTYSMMCLSASQGSGNRIGVFGTLTANGAGAYTSLLGSLVDSDAALSHNPPAPGQGTYDLNGNGRFVLDGTLVGGMHPSGSVAITSQTGAGNSPSICVLIRRSGAYTPSMLVGNYHFGFLSAFTGSKGLTVYSSDATGPAVADAVSSLSLPFSMSNAAGTQGVAGSRSPSFSITPDGVLEITGTQDRSTGALTRDGAFAVTSGDSSGSGPAQPVLLVLVRRSTGLSKATLSGRYWLVALGASADPENKWTSRTSTVVADGQGALTLDPGLENNEGVVASHASGTFSYTVDAAGTFHAFEEFSGAVTSDGNYAYLSGSTLDNGSPALFVLIRQ